MVVVTFCHNGFGTTNTIKSTANLFLVAASNIAEVKIYRKRVVVRLRLRFTECGYRL